MKETHYRTGIDVLPLKTSGTSLVFSTNMAAYMENTQENALSDLLVLLQSEQQKLEEAYDGSQASPVVDSIKKRIEMIIEKLTELREQMYPTGK